MKIAERATLIVGIYTDATGFGGAEVYLRRFVNYLVTNGLDVVLFHRDRYPIEVVFSDTSGFRRVITDNHETDAIQLKNNQTGDVKVSPSPRGNLSAIWKSALLKIVPSRTLFRLGSQREIRRLSKLLKPYALDALFVSETSPTPDVFSLAGKIAKVPRIVSRFAVMPEINAGASSSGRNELAAQVLNQLDGAIFNASATRDAWLDYTGTDARNTTVIPNGVDSTLFFPRNEATRKKERVRLALGIPIDTIVIGFTARLHPMKGHRYVIEAAVDLVRRFDNICFLLVGEGNERAAIESALTNFSLRDYFHVLGHRDDIAEITREYDIALLPSVAHESFGNVCIEAMACGVPVVASRFAGLPEVVDDGVTGMLVEPGSVAELKSALASLISDEHLRAKMGAAGRDKVITQYSLSNMLARTMQLLLDSPAASNIN